VNIEASIKTNAFRVVVDKTWGDEKVNIFAIDIY